LSLGQPDRVADQWSRNGAPHQTQSNHTAHAADQHADQRADTGHLQFDAWAARLAAQLRHPTEHPQRDAVDLDAVPHRHRRRVETSWAKRPSRKAADATIAGSMCTHFED
jgi:hypothetical protein